MRKQHVGKLKLHTIFTIVITGLFLIVLAFVRDISLAVAMLFLAVYIAGNGIIHIRHNELARDTIIEYILIGIIATVLFVSSFVTFIK
ncbi:MAG: hypothetical protein JWO99_713 [Candidatus Saccharibacteria bacterium]|nr:hypothetical protein [Candidatus Saccharibacteria bacterium]